MYKFKSFHKSIFHDVSNTTGGKPQYWKCFNLNHSNLVLLHSVNNLAHILFH